MTTTNKSSFPPNQVKGQLTQQPRLSRQRSLWYPTDQGGEFFHSNSYYAVSSQPASRLRSSSGHWSGAQPLPLPEWALYRRPDHHAVSLFSGKTVDNDAVKSLRSSNSLRRPSHDNDCEGIFNTKWQFATKSAPTSIFSSPVTSPHRLSRVGVDLVDHSINFSQDFNDTMTMRMPAKTAHSPDLSPRRSLGNHSSNYRHTIQDFPQDSNDILRMPAKTARSPDLSPCRSLGNHSPNYHNTIQDFPQDFNDMSRLPAKTTRSPDLSPRRSLGNHSPNYRHTIQDFNDASRLPAKTTHSPDLSPRRSLGNCSPNYRHIIQDFNDVSRLPAKTTRNPELSSCRSLGNRSPDYRHTIQDCKDISRLPAKTAHSPDLSPRHSLGNHSPNYRRTIQGGSHSHHSKYFTRVWLENNHVDGYPLPLPPRASPPPQQSPAQHQTNVTLHQSTENFHSMKGQWQKGKLIGRGSLGSVYMATNIETGTSCAMKEVDLLPDDPKFADCIKQLHQEIRIHGQLHHPNIVQYYGSEIVGDQVRIYMEYVQLGSLNKFMLEHYGAMTESVVRNFTWHILSGLAYLHSTKTIHRDIKCANLLVDASGIVKLAGFRMSKILTKKSSELLLNRSPYWMAPELMMASMKKATNPNVAMAVDIWSLGCTIIEMLTGKPPWSEFSGHQAMFKALHRSPDIPKTLSPEGHDFLEQCFRRNPVERPSAAELLTHAFVQKKTLDPKVNHVNIVQEAVQKIAVV